jgi:predicted DNA-binding transcriptional regulator AlpA
MHFAAAHPKLTFQPSDPDPDGRASADAWARHLGLTNVAPSIELDVTQSVSPSIKADVVICINMIHMAPWPQPDQSTGRGAGERLLRLPELVRTLGVSRATTYRYVGSGRLPPPAKRFTRGIAWRASEITAWMATLRA